MTALERVVDALHTHGSVVTGTGAQRDAQCPAHDDGNASLSVTQGTDKVLVKCHRGCDIGDVLGALGMTTRDLFDQARSNGNGRQIVATYDYLDAAGTLLFQVVRFEPKDFRQRRPDGGGGWVWKLGGTVRVLYRPPQVLEAAKAGQRVYVCEGEKDVHAIEKTGAVATCNPGGAGKWKANHSAALIGADVVVIADRDTPGRAHARDVLTSLHQAGIGAQLVEPATGKDVTDHLTAGHGLSDLAAAEHESAPVEPSAPLAPVSFSAPPETGAVLDDVYKWLSRFVSTMTDDDLCLLTLWAAHTHLVMETYTTPRLILDSPVPGSGKTTTLEHLERLCVHPVQMASLSSPALLTRMLDTGMRTILIDEADRSLDPKRDGVAELLAVLNSGYKRGGTRPVLVPTKDGWNVSEMPTYAPVAMAGNNPQLPEDTKSRSIRVVLLPDFDGLIEETDWELIDADARELGARLARWAEQVRDQIRTERPPLPEGIKGRARERWFPLKRVAAAAGGHWPEVVDALALHDKELLEMDREDGMIRDRPAVVLLKHLHDYWPEGETFVPTSDLIAALAAGHPEQWGDFSVFGKAITAQRLGRMLATGYKVNSTRLDRVGPRGYTRSSLAPAWRRMGIGGSAPVTPTPSIKPAQVAQPVKPAHYRHPLRTA